MKKFSTLLVAALPVMAMAQIESAIIDLDALGITSDNAPMAAQTILCQSENVIMRLAYDDSPKAAGIEANSQKGIWIGDEYFSAENGVQLGSANPKPNGFFEGPTEGAVAQFTVAKDGYIICMSKLSSNKNYWAYEGLGSFATAIAYDCGILWNTTSGDSGTPSPYVISLPSDDEGYIDLEADDIQKYLSYPQDAETGEYDWANPTGTAQLRYILTGDRATELSGNGFGFIGFPVYADAENYMLNAQGSKISLNGFIFIPTDTDNPADAKPASIWSGRDADWVDDEGVAHNAKEYEFKLDGSGAGISSVVADKNLDVNAPIYNVMGQKVDANTKGILIQNGQKFYNK